MKTRLGFVSNSSSSSFIIVGYEKNNDTLDHYTPDAGEYEFGWGPDTAQDIHSRINWMMITAGDDESKIDMIKDIIKKHQKEDSEEGFNRIDKLVNSEDYSDFAYIDHQSFGEGAELFSNENELERFIMNSGSYIKIGNDNS